jgi:hypothetical protein
MPRQGALTAWLFRLMERRVVRPGPSGIDGTGLFVMRAFREGARVGRLRLGPPGPQGKHTLLIGAQHRSVETPWRFLNHACRPSAVLRLTPTEALLFAARPLSPHAELTIDYAALPEQISASFACRCASCVRARQPARVGAAQPQGKPSSDGV